MRNLLQAEQERSPDFLRLSNALSALYPKESEEKRLLDAMLLDAWLTDLENQIKVSFPHMRKPRKSPRPDCIISSNTT